MSYKIKYIKFIETTYEKMMYGFGSIYYHAVSSLCILTQSRFKYSNLIDLLDIVFIAQLNKIKNNSKKQKDLFLFYYELNIF